MVEPVGGDLSLDFHNTVSWSAGAPVESESLHVYGDLVQWGVEHEALTFAEGEALKAEASRRPEDASRVFARAIELRLVLNEVFGSLAQALPVDPGSLDRFNTFLGDVRLRLGSLQGRGIELDWSGGTLVLERVLAPVIWAAASLLLSDDAGRIGACVNDRCGWLFVDRSRRHNRKWCNMRDCGNRAKARRHYYRHRKRNPR